MCELPRNRKACLDGLFCKWWVDDTGYFVNVQHNGLQGTFPILDMFGGDLFWESLPAMEKFARSKIPKPGYARGIYQLGLL